MIEEPRPRRPASLTPLLALLGVGVAVVIVGAFNRRWVAGQGIIESQQVLETKVALLERERGLLLTQVAYATTDAAVIEWAHAQGKQALEGEVLVVPLPGATPLPTPTSTPLPGPSVLSNWQLWGVLFFEQKP